MKDNWVDFKTVKANVSFSQVLEHYQINWLRGKGDELRGRCPIHKGEGERTFHVNLAKGAFHCFSCRAKGNILDFCAAMEQVSVRDAALKLRDWFLSEQSEEAKAEAKSEGTASRSEPEKDVAINPELTFQLRVNLEHAYGKGRGVTKETLEYFGAGFCVSRGMFAERFVVPLHDEAGRLVGYAGRSIDDREPKYLFPSAEKGFHKKCLVFNLHRTIKEVSADEPVVIVEGFFDCMRVRQAGYFCVAILGSSLSAEQEELLCQNFNHAVLLFDGDDAGRAATSDCLQRLSRRIFVRVVSIPDGKQPDLLGDEELRELLKQ